jgi:CheY-like chemotaxis protein
VQQSVLLLLIEDEPLVALSFQDALEEAGFGICHAGNGKDAMAALEESHGDLSGIITDIRLGDGIDGWEVARHAREMKPNIPVVYTSGDSAHEHTIHGVPESVILQKPFAPAQLITAIATLINAATPHQPS